MSTNKALNILNTTHFNSLIDLGVIIVTKSDFGSIFSDSSLEKIDTISYSIKHCSFCFSSGLFRAYISILDFSRFFIGNSIPITEVSLFYLEIPLRALLSFSIVVNTS